MKDFRKLPYVSTHFDLHETLNLIDIYLKA